MKKIIKRLFRKKTKINGWAARDKNGGLRIWILKPYKEVNFEYGHSWGRPCEMGAWIRVNEKEFPNVRWEDEEPTPVTITIKEK